MSGAGYLQAGRSITPGAWSNINYSDAGVYGNYSIVPVNTSNDSILIRSSQSGTVYVDILGCFSTNPRDKRYFPRPSPSRRLNWATQGPYATTQTRTVNSLAYSGNIAVGTTTLINGTTGMYVNVYNTSAPFPPSASANADPLRRATNMTLAEVNSSRKYVVRRSWSPGSTTIRYDEYGRFA